MRTLSLSILAASVALLPSGAIAQAAPQVVQTTQGGAVQAGMAMQQAGQMQAQHFQRRLQRGYVVPPYFWGPQFQINNWQMYGFPNPGAGAHWIRYYDDAYLIGQDGRIRDTREGLDWDRYGEQWDMTNGIPAYHGSRDYHPGSQDYAYAQGQMAYGQQMQGYGYGGGSTQVYGGGSTQVYGGGYGYGAYAYPIVIETTTYSAAAGCCAAASCCTEEVVEYVEVRRPRHRARPRCACAPRPAPVRRRPPPRPPAGERG